MFFNKNGLRTALIVIFFIILISSIILIVIDGPKTVHLVPLGVILILLMVMVRKHAEKTSYRCPSCGYNFKISATTDFISLHTPEKKLVKCPKCGKADWCTVVE